MEHILGLLDEVKARILFLISDLTRFALFVSINPQAIRSNLLRL